MFLLHILQALTLSLEENDRWLLEWGEVNKYSIRFSYFVAMGMDKNDYCFVGLDKKGNSYDLKVFKDGKCLGKTIYQNAVNSEIDNKIENLGIEIDTEKHKNVTFVDIEEIRYGSQEYTSHFLSKSVSYDLRENMLNNDGFKSVNLYCSEVPGMALLISDESEGHKMEIFAVNNNTILIRNFIPDMHSRVKFTWSTNGEAKNGYGMIKNNRCGNLLVHDENTHYVQLPKNTRLELIKQITLSLIGYEFVFDVENKIGEALEAVKNKPINMNMCGDDLSIKDYCPNMKNVMNGEIRLSKMSEVYSVAVLTCHPGYRSLVRRRECKEEDRNYYWDGPSTGFSCSKLIPCTDSKCKNGGTCDTVTSECTCLKGFSGFFCEMTSLPFYCGRNALNFELFEDGSFKCECAKGFVAKYSSKCRRKSTCEESDSTSVMNGKVIRRNFPYFERDGIVVKCDSGKQIKAVCRYPGTFYPPLKYVCDSEFSARIVNDENENLLNNSSDQSLLAIANVLPILTILLMAC